MQVLCGSPGYINLLDALNGWQLVSQLAMATGLSAAASFKHVSPAGVAVSLALNETERRMYFIGENEDLSPLATAYVRAVVLTVCLPSGILSVSATAVMCKQQRSSSGRSLTESLLLPMTLKRLPCCRKKKGGKYVVLQIDPTFEPPVLEKRSVYGITFTQERNTAVLDASVLEPIVTKRKDLSEEARLDLLVALNALKYTQSNSVCFAKRGQTIGVGAGQQSRIHCTRLAGEKADAWHLRQARQVLELPFLPTLSRNEKDNAVEAYLRSEIQDPGLYFSEDVPPHSQPRIRRKS